MLPFNLTSFLLVLSDNPPLTALKFASSPACTVGKELNRSHEDGQFNSGAMALFILLASPMMIMFGAIQIISMGLLCVLMNQPRLFGKLRVVIAILGMLTDWRCPIGNLAPVLRVHVKPLGL